MLLFYGNSGYANAPNCYVIVHCLSCFLPIALFFRVVLCYYLVQNGNPIFVFKLSLVCWLEVAEGTVTKQDVIFEESETFEFVCSIVLEETVSVCSGLSRRAVCGPNYTTSHPGRQVFGKYFTHLEFYSRPGQARRVPRS